MVFMCNDLEYDKWVFVKAFPESASIKDGKACVKHTSKWVCPKCGNMKVLIYEAASI